MGKLVLIGEKFMRLQASFFMKILYILLITLINPFGLTIGSIWALPKIVTLFAITTYNTYLLISERNNIQFKKTISLIKPVGNYLFLFFLICLYNSLASPAGIIRSLIGHPVHYSGLVYWVLLFSFVVSNSLLIAVKPSVLKKQIEGLIIGGFILFLSMIPQVIDWRIDYTFIKEFFENNVPHQPVGLYSHRGHAGFVLSAIAIILISAYKENIVAKKYLWLLPLIVLGLILTRNKGGIISFIGGLVYVKFPKQKLALYLAIALVSFTILISIPAYHIKSEFGSGRLYLWGSAFQRVIVSPIKGYGMDGFTTAYFYGAPKHHERLYEGNYKILGIINDYSITRIKQGDIGTTEINFSKAHNLLLDWAASIGIPGACLYLVIFGYFFKVSESPFSSVAVAYIIYTFTWFESGQFSHIAWWSLSLLNYEKIISNSNFTLESEVSSSMEFTIRNRVSAAVKKLFKKLSF
ncbi:MAG: O-antigen ligase domain-containing protein [Dolichospermum sp.]|nr:O-antigen ligase domain-containing protein [Dolichospermum sp.]